MLGVTLTVRVALALVTFPAMLDTTTEYCAPLSAAPEVGFSTYDEVIAPEMATPIRRHWYNSGAVPEAVTEKVAEFGCVTVTFAGWTLIEGATACSMVSTSVALLLPGTGSLTPGALTDAVLLSVPVALPDTVPWSV